MPKNVYNTCTCKDMGYCCEIKLTLISEHLVEYFDIKTFPSRDINSCYFQESQT